MIGRLLNLLFGRSGPTPCPYCPNPDRDTIYEHWSGCEYRQSKSGEDPPCVCDGHGSGKQLGRLGLGK